jgi:hypothetical protein
MTPLDDIKNPGSSMSAYMEESPNASRQSVT